MRKSNWIILAVLALAAGFFLWLWYYLGFNFVDDPLDLVIAIVWWAVVAALVLAIRAAEKKRQKRVRTAYLAPDALFNSEVGLVKLGEDANLVDVLERMIADLRYSFDRADLPDEEDSGVAVKFERIVRTDKFDKDDADAWEGEVVDVATKEAVPFKGKVELVKLVAA